MRFTNFLAATMALAGLAVGAAVPNNDGANLVLRGTTKPVATKSGTTKTGTTKTGTTKPSNSKPPAAGPLVAGSGIFKNIKATQASWDHVQAACRPGKPGKKRGLESRAMPPDFVGVPVAMGISSGHGEFPFGLYTEGLVTCFGIVVKGTATSANPKANTRWLFHMVASKALSNWDDFEKKITDSKLSNMKGYMSLPSPAAVGTIVEGRAWTQGDQDLTNNMIKTTKEELEKLTKNTVVVHPRPMQPPSSMQVSAEGEVKAGNNVLV